MIHTHKIKYLLVLLCLIPSIHGAGVKWEITRQWNETEEELFSEFISTIGKAVKSRKCFTTDQCLRSPIANPLFAKKNPSGLSEIFSDCADLPYVLRGYFAFMRGLPFVFPQGVTFYSPEIEQTRAEYYRAKAEYDRYSFWNRPREVRSRYKDLKDKLEDLLKDAGKDIRYSRSGNKITALKKIQGGENINSILDQIVGSVSTASFRVDASRFDQGSVFKDTYAIKLDRENLKPGTVLYDPAGHIALVSEVTDSGKIYLIDAHPDNSITYIAYGEKFSRSPVSRGAGFVNWRPYSYSNGNYRPVANKDLDGYALEQFYGYPENPYVDFRKAEYNFNGTEMDYYHFVRARLSLDGLSVNPIEEFAVALDDLCRDFKDRVDSVDKAVAAGLHDKKHPKALPENIYGTDGEWETYSTPSRDARLKASVREIYNTVREYLDPSLSSGLEVEYDGANLKGDLAKIFTAKTKSCKYSFKKSNGVSFQTNLKDSLQALFKLSFDPYHCIELRWGLSGDDLNTCSQSEEKWDWYREEQPLRNQIERDYSKFMGYELNELGSSGLGVRQSPQINIEELLY
ncbi:MAG: hypothetical protein CME60_07275 [Halobacteriovoraceae bacterium]|nr:hypothetical protein [Halobacteriovoraceae bacterium]